MDLNPTQIKLLTLASRLPAFGFYQGMLMAYHEYFRSRNGLFLNLIQNERPDIPMHKRGRFLTQIKKLIASNYLQAVRTKSHDLSAGERPGVNSIFKITDKAWRSFSKDEAQRRIHYNTRNVTCVPHDILVASVLLTFCFERGYYLMRPSSWRANAPDSRCPLPDGVIASKFGTISAVEVERSCSARHLEWHMIYHGRESNVFMIFEQLSRSTADVALALLKKFELKNWYFTSCKQFFASAGQGPYINWRGIAHYINPEGEVVDKQTWINGTDH